MLNLSGARDVAENFLKDNATTILTAGGVVGTVATAVLTGRSTLKAAELIREEQSRIYSEMNDEREIENPWDVELTTSTKIKLVWPQFIPPTLVGSATIGSIIMANRMSAQKAAALAAVYGLSEKRLKEYQAKVAEKLTGPKNQQIHDELAQDQVNSNPPQGQVLVLSGDKVLCFDQFSGRYFQSMMETIRKAENSVNAEIFNHQYASLNYFYEELDLPQTEFGDDVGWSMMLTGPCELRFSTVMSVDDRPCIAIGFVNAPVANYRQNY